MLVITHKRYDCTRANLGFGYSWNSRFVLRSLRIAKPKKSVSRSASGKFYGLHWKIKLSFLNSRTKWLFVKNDDNSKWCIVTTDEPILDSPIRGIFPTLTNPKLAWLSDQGNIFHVNQSNLALVAPEQSCARLWLTERNVLLGCSDSLLPYTIHQNDEWFAGG